MLPQLRIDVSPPRIVGLLGRTLAHPGKERRCNLQSTLACASHFGGVVTLNNVISLSDGASTCTDSVTQSFGGAINAYGVVLRIPTGYTNPMNVPITTATTATAGNVSSQSAGAGKDAGAAQDIGSVATSGLSTGAVAGIAIGSVLAGIIITAVLGPGFYKHRKGREGRLPKDPAPYAPTESSYQSPGGMYRTTPVAQWRHGYPAEIDGYREFVEADTSQPRGPPPSELMSTEKVR
ncbi:hypothetical protein GGR56DRAFT_642866 [Xylariaceae sp. FL0804]|nr:hypothetical protein GGR56DRAFT_642866 [Xylariaceae sp. FL0804]